VKLADKISLKLQQYVCQGNTDIVIPNYFVGFYEMDLFRLLQSGMLWEYEIKISRGDFKNDFKKGSKHILMSNKKGHCNRFYFVTPKGLIHTNEVPSYAGLIEFNVCENGEVGLMQVIKNAPMIHKEKVTLDFYKTIAYKLSFRERSTRAVLRIQAFKNAERYRLTKTAPQN